MSQIHLNQDNEIDKENLESMTTVIGFKCADGIVIASDSQASFEKKWELKKLGVDKILRINNFIALGASGEADHVKLLVEELRENLGDSLLSDKEIRKKIYDVLLSLHKKYNIERAKFLGIREDTMYFRPNTILGAKLSDSTFGLYRLKPDAWISSVEDYKTLGSGAALAELVIKPLIRFLVDLSTKTNPKTIINISTLSLEIVLPYASYVINEVKSTDKNSGGFTKVVVIDKNGVRQLLDDEVNAYYEEFQNVVSDSFQQLIPDSKNHKILPEN